MSLTSFRALVRGVHKVTIGTVLSEAEETFAIQSAIAEYAAAMPQRLRAYLSHSGKAEYSVTEWVPGWLSTYGVADLVAPVGQSSEQVLNCRDYQLSQRDSGLYLVLGVGLPLGSVMALEYLVSSHQVADPNTNTIPAADQFAVVQLAAAYVLQNAANKYSANASSTISADAVSQSEQAKSYAFQADDARKNYLDHVSRVRTGRSARVGWTLDAHNGRGRLFNQQSPRRPW